MHRYSIHIALFIALLSVKPLLAFDLCLPRKNTHITKYKTNKPNQKNNVCKLYRK